MFRERLVEYQGTGWLEGEELRVPISFSCSQLFDGEIQGTIEITDEDHTKYFTIFAGGREFSIRGQLDDERKIQIDRVSITERRERFGEKYEITDVKFQALSARVILRELAGKEIMVRIGVMNFDLFAASLETRIGKVIFLKHPNHDRMTKDIRTHKKGCLTCFARVSIKPDLRFKDANEIMKAVTEEMERVLILLSFAQGTYQNWLSCEVCERIDSDNFEIVTTYHRLPVTKSVGFNPVIHTLNIQNYLPKVYANYTAQLDETTGFRYAVEWYIEALSAGVTEPKLIIGFICLELLVDKFEKRNNREYLLDNPVFVKFSKELKKKAKPILEDLGVEPGRRSAIYSTMRGLNRYPFSSSLELLLIENKIGFTDIFKDLTMIIKIRNEIVHQGLATVPFPKLLDNYLRIMCLIQRILLSYLNYDGGSMLDWLNNYEGKVFVRDPIKQH